MILQSEPAELRARSALRLEIELLLWHRIAFLEVRYFLTVKHDNCVIAVQSDIHRVPLWARLPGVFHQRFGHGVQQAGVVILILMRLLGLIYGLQFLTKITHMTYLFGLARVVNTIYLFVV